MDGFPNLGEIGYGFLKEFLKEKRKDIGKFFVKNKVGFLPEGMDFNSFQDMKNDAIFRQLKHLIGKHETLPIILVGLHLHGYSGHEKRRVAEENRNEVYKRHKARGISILNIASTGFIEAFISWISEYNIKNNPSRLELVDLYEKILDDWEEMSFFVKSLTSKKVLSNNVIGRINSGKPTSFVFASGSAIPIAEGVMNNLEKEIFESGYSISTNKLNNSSNERVWIISKNKDKQV